MTRPPVLEIGSLSLDPTTQRVARDGTLLDLAPKEYAMLHVLLRHAGEVVSRSRLAEQLWKAALIAIDNRIDSPMSNLRRKIDPPGVEALIQTVRGRGFRIAKAGDA